MKPITDKLMMKGLEHTSHAPYKFLAETGNVIVTVDRDSMVHEWRISDGYSFLRDQWRVWGKNIGAYMCDGRPFVVIAETDNFWILKDYNGKENYWMKCNCELRPFTTTIEITCKINGRESKLSDISEETLLKIREG